MKFTNFEDSIMKVLGPLAQKVSGNNTLRAISQGFMRTMPITLGIALFAILGSLPIPGWSEWIVANGMKTSFDAALGASTSVLSLYVAFSIAYCFAKNANHNAITSGFLSMASFIILMPQTIEGKEKVVSALLTQFLGADGMVVALLVSLVVSRLYCALTDKGITFKMPDSVPPNVSESLAPIFVAMIIFGLVVGTRIAFSFTSYGTIFACISQLVSAPLMKFGASVPSIFVILFLANTVWFFGIHPNTIQGPIQPLLMMVIMSSITSFRNGEPLEYLSLLMVYSTAVIGGNGNTLGLICSMFTAKSKRYKSMLKLAIVPNLFNINEPLIFGMPIMLNPIFFIPMTFSCVVMGAVGLLGAQLISIVYNPMMLLLPWTTPFVLKAFLSGGIPLLIIAVVALAANTLLYFPFFKMADRQAALQEQQEEVKEKEHVILQEKEKTYAV